MSSILVTGAAGFIGYHLAQRLLDSGVSVVGLDNMNDYYDVGLKQDRLARLMPSSRFRFVRTDLADRAGVEEVFAAQQFDGVVHLAAQAGVRHSLTNPHAYAASNLDGFLHVLEGCRQSSVAHLVYASSSSVYGANTQMPYSTSQVVDHPLSLYAATKKANELMAHTYSHLYGLPTTGLRFFTVYGPWGRPDMALFKFTRAILAGESIDVYNHGKMQRDFTYVDDIVEGINRVLGHVPVSDPVWDGASPNPSTSTAPYRIYNIGNSAPVELLDVIAILERALDRKASLRMLPMQPGDVPVTFADVTDLEHDVGFRPTTPIDEGIPRFVEWYRAHYGGTTMR